MRAWLRSAAAGGASIAIAARQINRAHNKEEK